MSRVVRTIACALALGVSVVGAAVAQTASPLADDDSAPLTVLTMAPDGAWGAGSAPTTGAAIAAAVAGCRRSSGKGLGCGAYSTAIRGGWSLGIQCGGQNILASAKTLVEAEQAAIDREVELRRFYLPEMPPCIRVVSVDPSGAVIAPDATDFLRLVMRRHDDLTP
jgi:hypothetical protein